jgi:hypothetical protein
MKYHFHYSDLLSWVRGSKDEHQIPEGLYYLVPCPVYTPPYKLRKPELHTCILRLCFYLC